MSDAEKEEKQKTDGGLSVNKDGINCLFCRCKRNTYHKETKTTTEDNKVVVNVVENRSSFKMGRGVSPDDGIFKPEQIKQTGSIEICDTGWGKKIITPEECDEKIEELREKVDDVQRDVEQLKQNNINLLD